MMLGGSFCEFLADARGNTDTWGMRASFEDCDTSLRSTSLRAAFRALRRRPRDGQQPRIALYGSSYFGPHPTAFSIMPAGLRTAMERRARTRTMWQQKHTDSGRAVQPHRRLHRALLEHHVPHVYNNCCPAAPMECGMDAPALDF